MAGSVTASQSDRSSRSDSSSRSDGLSRSDGSSRSDRPDGSSRSDRSSRASGAGGLDGAREAWGEARSEAHDALDRARDATERGLAAAGRQSELTRDLAASGVLRELSIGVDGPVAHPAELGQGAWGGSDEQVVLAQSTIEANPLPPDGPGAGATLRRVPGLGVALLTADGLCGLDALAERRLHEGAGLALGLDMSTPEGLGAAEAYYGAHIAARGVVFSRWGSAVDYASLDGAGGAGAAGPGTAKVAAEAAALVELGRPGTFRAAQAGEAEAVARLEGAIRAAQAALQAGRLQPAEDFGWSDGWVETYPDLTDAERALGDLPGFVPGRLDEPGWQEEFPALPPEGPQHTGHGGGLDGLGLDEPLIFVPAPEELRGATIHEMPRPGEPTPVRPQDDAETQRGHQRENEVPEVLTNAGYRVVQNPVVPGPRKPDFLVNGEVFDNYAPITGNVRNIWFNVRDKVEGGQAPNIVLDLRDSTVDVDALRQQFADWPIEGLGEVILIRPDNSVGRL